MGAFTLTGNDATFALQGANDGVRGVAVPSESRNVFNLSTERNAAE